jgi:hypothetical protein
MERGVTAQLAQIVDDWLSSFTKTGEAEEEIKQTIEADPGDFDVQHVVDVLADLNGEQAWQLLRSLAFVEVQQQLTYNKALLNAAEALGNALDPRPLATAMAAQLAHDAKELHAVSVTALVAFAKLLLILQDEHAYEILRNLGMKHAGDFLSAFRAKAAEAGLYTFPPDVTAAVAAAGVPFGPWKKPGNQPFWLYIGREAHTAIATMYAEAHLHAAPFLWLNANPTQSILDAHKVVHGFEPGPITAILAAGKPDIFEFMIDPPARHPAPGLIYEIKPMSPAQVALGRAQVAQYLAAFMLSGVLCSLGPPTPFPGTKGVIPAPNGRYNYECLEEGLISYWYVPAPLVEVLARDKKESPDKDTTKVEFTDQLLALGVAVEFAALAAMLVIALSAGGILGLT